MLALSLVEAAAAWMWQADRFANML